MLIILFIAGSLLLCRGFYLQGRKGVMKEYEDYSNNFAALLVKYDSLLHNYESQENLYAQHVHYHENTIIILKKEIFRLKECIRIHDMKINSEEEK